MSFLVWANASPPLDAASDLELEAVRDTDIAVIPDEAEAMEDTAPQKAAPPDVDPRVRLGLATRSTASYVVPSEKYAPEWAGYAVGQVERDAIPSAGTAAKREMDGEFGHGSMSYAIGIAPAIGNSPGFGESYFATWDKPIQDNETAREWGIQGIGFSQGSLSADGAYAAEQMIKARHAAETSSAYDLSGLWD